MSKNLQELKGNVIINKISEKEKKELITNDHPWLGHPNFLFTKNIEHTVRVFYSSYETDIVWAAMRSLLLDDEPNFRLMQKKYKELEQKILDEIKWAKENPEKIKNPGKVEYQETKAPDGGQKLPKNNPFFSAVIDSLNVSNLEKHSKVKEVYIPEEKQKRIDVMSNMPHKKYDDPLIEDKHFAEFKALEGNNPKLLT